MRSALVRMAALGAALALGADVPRAAAGSVAAVAQPAPGSGSAATASAAAAAAADPVTLAIGQGFGAPPDITIALDLVDESGRAPATLDPRAIAATIGAHDATVVRATPFEATRDGAAYIFLVDVSQSLSASEMARVRDALRLWASSAHATDRFALIAFGDDVSTRLDFTADRAAFQQAVDALVPRARTTQLHTAIERAVALSRRRDADLPARRVAVLLSDGQDEGSGLTADDIAALLRQDRLPIYAIGYSRLRGEARQRGFDSLRRLARNSGGLFGDVASTGASGAPGAVAGGPRAAASGVAPAAGASGAPGAPRASRTSAASASTASTATIAELYRAMQHAVTRVFSIALHCPSCVGDGQLHRLQVQVKTGTRVLSDGIDLRLPVSASGSGAGRGTGSGATSTAAGGGSGTGGASASSGASARTSSATSGSGVSVASFWTSPAGVASAAIAIVGVLAAGALVAFRATRRRRGGTELGNVHRDGDGHGGSASGGSSAADAATDVPESIAVTCHFRGRHAPAPQTVTLRDRVTVGTDASCAVVIADDHEVAAAHCELAWHAGHVTLRRLDAQHPTLVNGAAVSPTSTYRLESGDVVLLGRTEFRVLFGEAEEALS